MVREQPEGMALPLLLLFLLTLTALGHGTLLLARRELQATWAFRHAIRADQAAEAAVRLGIDEGMILQMERVPMEGHPVRSGESEDGLIFRSVLRWIDQEFFLLEGSGGSRGWSGERRRARVGWSLYPEVRLAAFGAGGEMGEGFGRDGGTFLDTGEFFGTPEDWPESQCERYRATLDSLFPGGPPPPLGPLAEPDVYDPGAGASIPSLGLLSGSQLLGALEGNGSHPYVPQDSGPDCPGKSTPGFSGADGSMSLDRGRFCGLLVVAGDLRLEGDVRFQGLALVGGELTLADGSVFEGMARVRKGIRMTQQAVFRPQSCPVLWALDGLPLLRRPLPLPSGARLGGF